MELAIDTSTRYASVGLSEDGQAVAEIAWRSAQNHSVELVPAIQRLLEGACTTVSRLDAVFVAIGPGGFSALRVGLSTAKALALAEGLPLIGVRTLDIESCPYLTLGLPVCAILEAGRDLLYFGMSTDNTDGAAHEDSEYRVVTREELVESIAKKTLFCGEAAPSLAEWLQESLGTLAVVADSPPPTRRAGVLARLGHQRRARGEVDDLDALQPIYMRGSQFEVAHRRWVG